MNINFLNSTHGSGSPFKVMWSLRTGQPWLMCSATYLPKALQMRYSSMSTTVPPTSLPEEVDEPHAPTHSAPAQWTTLQPRDGSTRIARPQWCAYSVLRQQNHP